MEPRVLTIELEQEDDGRYLAEVLEVPGVLAYGATPAEAVSRVKALCLRVLADRQEAGEVQLEALRFESRSAA